MIHKSRIILTEEIEQLEQVGEIKPISPETLERLYAILTPRQIERLIERMEEAQKAQREIVVGVKFTRGHPKDLVVTDSETFIP